MRILYLDLDTLRPDNLGCYGYHRNTSPIIDTICAEAVHFDNYYCSDAPCLSSRSAVMTRTFEYHSGIVGHRGTADAGTCRIPLIIKWPGGKIDAGLHYNWDLGITLAELISSKNKTSIYNINFAATIKIGTNTGQSYLILSQCAHVCQKAVRWEPRIYIKNLSRWEPSFS